MQQLLAINQVDSDHTCALRNAPSSPMCWGQNFDGQFGNGTTGTYSLIPTAASSTLTTVTSVSVGQYHTCALKSDHTVACWGLNSAGQIGDGTISSGVSLDKPTPTATSVLTTVSALTSASQYNCALQSGSAYCWGNTPLGQKTTPTLATGLTDLTSIAAGFAHVCAVRAGGTAVCWGDNSLSQLGRGESVIGSPSSSSTPAPVQVSAGASTTDLTGVVAVSAGQYHSCALLTDKTVRCWGSDNSDELGDNSAAYPAKSTVATVVGLSTVTAIVSGKSFNCALLADQTVKCWGANDAGQLGNGSKTQGKTPSLVSGVTGAVAIAAGATHACALLASGDIKCWGANGTYGNLGNNSTSESLTAISTSAAAATFYH